MDFLQKASFAVIPGCLKKYLKTLGAAEVAQMMKVLAAQAWGFRFYSEEPGKKLIDVSL